MTLMSIIETSRDSAYPLPRRRTAFTLIELMVVIGIIILAAGLMTPTLADFFRNKALEAVRGEFGSIFNRARLQAVTQGRDISVVFFREGGRIYDERNRIFEAGEWTGSSSTLGRTIPDIWYILGCADDQVSCDPGYGGPDASFQPTAPFIPPFDWWFKRQDAWRKKVQSGGGSMRDDEFDVTGLAKVIFHRDGTMSFGPGLSDVRSADWQKEPAINADVKILQVGSLSGCFMDLRPTGQTRSKITLLPAAAVRPGEETETEEPWR
ncbi:MAG: prepilin-type N-terminal cleavage/methylation domain-containing protein [Planctomycetes bacterium]|nr:prepilin-type N-terminal cleavage/methylation domain-containing protein [Planctomycetota bacterium]